MPRSVCTDHVCRRCRRKKENSGVLARTCGQASGGLGRGNCSQAQGGYPKTIYETMDEFDEFAMNSGEQTSFIQEGENPPFVASSDSVSIAGSHARSRSASSQILTTQLLERAQYQTPQCQKQQRLVRMDEIVERLWERHDEEPEHEDETLEAAMRSSFYRPSMIQSTKRTDIDLTATWHGDIQTEIDWDSANGSLSGLKLGSLFSQDSGLKSQDPKRTDFLSTFGHSVNTLFTGGSEVSSGPTGFKTHSRLDNTLSIGSLGNNEEKHSSHNAPHDEKVPKTRRWFWARCVEKLKSLKRPLKSKDTTESIAPAVSRLCNRPCQAQRKCFSCLGPKGGSCSSSFGVDVRSHTNSGINEGSPFLTTSALFDDPRTPPPLATSESLMYFDRPPLRGPSSYANSLVCSPREHLIAPRVPQDMSELWDDSEVGSSRGSFQVTRTCWVPPVLKSDQEYEASRVLGNNLKTGTSKFNIYDPKIAACEAKDCILKSLGSKSSWDIHSIALDDSNYDSVTFIDQGNSFRETSFLPVIVVAVALAWVVATRLSRSFVGKNLLAEWYIIPLPYNFVEN